MVQFTESYACVSQTIYFDISSLFYYIKSKNDKFDTTSNKNEHHGRNNWKDTVYT